MQIDIFCKDIDIFDFRNEYHLNVYNQFFQKANNYSYIVNLLGYLDRFITQIIFDYKNKTLIISSLYTM